MKFLYISISLAITISVSLENPEIP